MASCSTVSSPTPEYRLAPSWWAGGLALGERLPAPGSPGASPPAAAERLRHWQDAHGLAAGGAFAARLADANLDEAGLTALLAEPATSVATRTARPDWVELVERTVSDPTAGDGAAVEPSLEAFALPLRPFTDAARDRLVRGAARAAAHVDLVALGDDFAAALGDRLVRLAARTFVLELNVARVSGRLTGATGRERFADYVRVLSTGGLTALFDEYPVLARILAQTCQHAVDARLELLDRFVADRAAIVADLFDGTDPGRLLTVAADLGDSHQHGRAVALVRFTGGQTVVYKPRSQALQCHFTDLVRWLNDKIPWLELRPVAALARDGYGWLEFVSSRACTSVAEVDRFYRRQGALLALLYAVDATDIHYENLIAAGDQPVLVDVETLFHPTIAPATTAGPDPAQRALAASVTRTALLPHLLVGEHGALDVSGLGGDKDTTFPFDAVNWDAGGTDEMRLVRRPVAFHGAVNRPRFDGRDIDPSEYRSALLSGFRAGYDALVAHRAELVGSGGLIERCADDEIRIVVRPTRSYTTLLDESTHPDLLRDGLDRERLYDVLWADAVHSPTLRRLVRHESAGLWAGDVPLFTGRPRSCDMWTSAGERIPGVLAGTSLDGVTAKIMNMDELDRLDQEWLITAAMATRAGPVDHRGGDPAPAQAVSAVPDQQRLLTAACGIADQIVARSMQDGQRANWLGLQLVDGQHWAIMPMGAGLADGYSGVALFLAQLGQLTGSRRYRDLARKALRPVPRLLEAFTADHDLAAFVGPGGFLGTGGISYALSRVSTLLDDHEIASWLPAAIELTGTMGESTPDIATGNAGGLLAMHAVHAETGLESAANAAGILAGELAWNAESYQDGDFPPTGFAGGPTGVAYALRRHAGPGHPPHAPSPPGNDGYGWCSGLSGTLLAHADLLDESPDPATCAKVDRWVTALTERRPLRDASLCHGELGIAEPLVVLAQYGHERAARGRTQYAARALGALDQYGPQCGTPNGVPCPGLLNGLAGIGYGLLRLGFAEQVPSILLLEPKFLTRGTNVLPRTTY